MRILGIGISKAYSVESASPPGCHAVARDGRRAAQHWVSLRAGPSSSKIGSEKLERQRRAQSSMNLRQVEIFCAVMRCRTTIAAAFELGLSQPAVSNAIKNLESQLGFSLFDRIGNRLVPTTEARSLFADAEPLHAMARGISRKARELRNTTRGHLRFFSTHALRHVVPRAIATFMKSRPDVHVFFDTLPMEGVIEAVESGFSDFGIALAPANRPGIAKIPILSGRMVVAMHPNHELASRKGAIEAKHIADEKMIALEPASRLGLLVRQAFDDAGTPYVPAVEVRHGSTACALVQEEIGVAVVDEFSAYGHDPLKLIVRPFVPVLQITGFVMHLQHRPLSRLAVRCIDEMKRMFSHQAVRMTARRQPRAP